MDKSRDLPGVDDEMEEGGQHYLVVSYIYQANVEFIVIRESWTIEVDGSEPGDDGGESEKVLKFLWPRNWSSMTQKELEGLYEQKRPGSDWKTYQVLKCHKRKATLQEARGARKRAEVDFSSKKKKLSEIGDTTDDANRTRETRKNRTRRVEDINSNGNKKARSSSSTNQLSSKISGQRGLDGVYGRKSDPPIHDEDSPNPSPIRNRQVTTYPSASTSALPRTPPAPFRHSTPSLFTPPRNSPPLFTPPRNSPPLGPSPPPHGLRLRTILPPLSNHRRSPRSNPRSSESYRNPHDQRSETYRPLPEKNSSRPQLTPSYQRSQGPRSPQGNSSRSHMSPNAQRASHSQKSTHLQRSPLLRKSPRVPRSSNSQKSPLPSQGFDPLHITPMTRSGQHVRTPRTMDSFIKALGDERFLAGQPLEGVQFKFYMTGVFLGMKTLQTEMAMMRSSSISSGSIQPPPPPLGVKPLTTVWPLNAQTFVDQEDELKDGNLLEETTLWLSNTNNSLYSVKYGEMTKNILQKMFPLELQASFVFSKDSYSKTEVRFEGTRSWQLVRSALEKAHGSGKEKLTEYRDSMQFWWDHKADNFKDFLRRKENAHILARFGDDTMLLRDRVKLYKEYYATKNSLDPVKFRYDKAKM